MARQKLCMCSSYVYGVLEGVVPRDAACTLDGAVVLYLLPKKAASN